MGTLPDAGDDFAAFVTGSSRRLLHAADLLTGDRSRAEDFVQHALIRTYLRWPALRDGNPEAYTRKIVFHAYLDWWRRLRWRELPERPDDEAALLPDHATAVARRDAVHRALTTLTRRERAVVVLRFWYDLPESQIAAELGVAPGTVKSTLSRALGKLRGNEHLRPPALDATTSPKGALPQ